MISINFGFQRDYLTMYISCFHLSFHIIFIFLAFPLILSLAVESHCSQIEMLLNNGDYQKAQNLVSDWKKEPSDGITQEEILFGEGCVRLHSGCLEDAARLFRRVADGLKATNSPLFVEANAKLGRALSLSGDMNGAIAAWSEEVKATLACKRQNILKAKQPTYYLNRLELDGAMDVWQSIYSREVSSLKSIDYLLQFNLFILNLDEYFTGMRKMTVETAEMLIDKGLKAQAVALCLRAISTGEDRCFQQKARLHENQRQLNLVALPISHEEIMPLFCILGKVYPLIHNDILRNNSALQELSKDYCHALSYSWKPNGGAGSALKKLSAGQQSIFWKNLLNLEASLAFFREGFYVLAISCLSELKQNNEFIQRSEVLEGINLMAQGMFTQAILKFENVIHVRQLYDDNVLVSKAMLLCGEAYEANRSLPKARENWNRLLLSSRVLSHRREASMALQRIDTLKDLSFNTRATSIVQPLAENRSTHGDWPMNFGREFHLLAAQQGKIDTIGYASPQCKMICNFHTNTEKEKCRLWISQTQSDDYAALWNPYKRCKRAANRDDYGEQYPIGTGPDLVLDCEIPLGRHILSLYFVNDFNYYEANRSYTIVLQENSQLLSIVPLRWFGGGVYKRFAIDGPRKLEVQIKRNASINVLINGVFLDKRSGLFTSLEKAELQNLFNQDHNRFKCDNSYNIDDYHIFEIDEFHKAFSKNISNVPFDKLLKANLLMNAGYYLEARKSLMEAVDAFDALENENDFKRVEDALFLLCFLDYWIIGGYAELWNGEHPHILEHLWNAWLNVRRKRVLLGDVSMDSHQHEVLQLMQKSDWRIVASVRKKMWDDCFSIQKDDLASWANYAISKQCQLEHNESEQWHYLSKALTAVKNSGEEGLHVRILETFLNWQCNEYGKQNEALATYRELTRFSSVTSQQRGNWCIQLYNVYANFGEYDRALKWLENAERFGVSKRQIVFLRESLERRRKTCVNNQ